MSPEHAIRQYMQLAYAIADRYYVPGGDREDVRQEALVGLFKANRDYDKASPVPFTAFARLCVERQVVTAVKTATRLKHETLSRAISLATPLTDGEGGTLEDVIPAPASADPAARVIELETFRRQRDILARSTRTERAAVAHVLNGGHIDSKEIDNALQRVRDKLGRAAA